MLPLYAIEGIGLTSDEIAAVEKHLVSCKKCKQELNDTKLIISLIDCHRDELLRRGAFDTPALTTPNEQINSGEPDILRPSGINRRWFKTASAIAACLIIVVAIWFSLSQKPSQLPELQPLAVAQPQITVELIDGKSKIAIPSGTTITTNKDEVKTLIINGNRQMTLNANTRLMIEPLTQNGVVGCMTKLDIGEIYTHVEHDGKPFVVQTQHGKAVITGTTFDVKATNDSTTLVVSEGTVKFESESGTVKVAAGQMSEVVGQSAPSISLSCNIAELTAWVTGYKSGHALVKTELNPDPWDLPLSFGEKSIILAGTGYKQWVEQKREWFKTNFPWIFELKDALDREGIEADYPELLIKSGDVWQFVCLQEFPARFSTPDFGSMLKAVSSYGFDKEWLLKNVPTAKSVQNKSLLLQNSTGLATFEQLLKYANVAEDTLHHLYLVDACKYLAETRSLIWFAADTEKFNLADNQRIEVLDLLQQEVTTAYTYVNDLLFVFDKPKVPLCDEDLQKSSDAKIVDGLRAMKAIEKIMMEYRIVN